MTALPVIYAEAQACTSCLDWHQRCGAECCQEFRVRYPRNARVYRGMVVHLAPTDLSPDLKWYLELHGVSVVNGVVSFQLNEFTRSGDFLTVRRRCDYLTPDLKCRGHPDAKPRVCSEFGLAAVEAGAFATPNCVFKYQAEAKRLERG